MGARLGFSFELAGQHAGTEADLAASGVAFTALRHGFYAASCLHMIGDGLKAGQLRTPEGGPVSWTARAARKGAWTASPPLTASRALTMAAVAALASDVTGREVRHVTVPDEEWRDAKIKAGMPAIYAEMLLGTFRAARRGDFAGADGTLEALLERPPLTFREVMLAATGR